jgi:hypothetical protein
MLMAPVRHATGGRGQATTSTMEGDGPTVVQPPARGHQFTALFTRLAAARSGRDPAQVVTADRASTSDW